MNTETRHPGTTLRTAARVVLRRLGLTLALAATGVAATLPDATRAAAFDFDAPAPIFRGASNIAPVPSAAERAQNSGKPGRFFVPDLRVESLDVIYVGEYDYMEYRQVIAVVSNGGNGPSGPFTVRLRAGDCPGRERVEEFDVPLSNLRAGERRTVRKLFQMVGRDRAEVRVDVHGEVQESNESNNAYGGIC
jgi:hypothetical protein